MMLAARNLLRTTLFAFALVGPSFAQTFSAPKHYPPFTDRYQFVVGDFNRDGAADLIGVANVSGSTQIYLYLNNGSGAFGTPKPISGTSGVLQAQVGDFNQDGNLDFAFAKNAQVGVCLGNGKGSFSAPVFHNVNGSADSIAVGDFNIDGKADIAALSDSTKTVTVLSNTGSSFSAYHFTVPLYYSSHNSGYPPDHVSSLVAGDLRGVHRFDLAYLDACADSSCGPGLSRIYALSNNGNNSFTPHLLNDQVSGSGQMFAADVDLDGRVDLLVSASAGGNGAALFVEYSNANGSFTQVYADDSNINAGIPLTLAVGDFNNDDIEDVAALTDLTLYDSADSGFDVYTGKGGRSGFNAPKHFADNTNYSPRGGFAAAFFDKDGKRDIALDDATGLAQFLNTTATTNDPCTYLTGVGLHRCLPAANGSGRSPVRVLATYKAAVQPAQRIEFWADGKKLFQEYGDLLKVSVPLAVGTHQLSVVGVDATGKYVKSNITYTVTP
jgi:hypothetical protein